MAKDCALSSKTDTEVVAEELKRIFTTDKAVLEQAKVKTEADLLKIIEVYNHNLKLGR